MIKSTKPKYSYNYFALGCPIIQYPQDMIAIQELIWEVKPDLIIETGIAHGGSVIMSASALALLDICEAIKNTLFLKILTHSLRLVVVLLSSSIIPHRI